MQETYGEWTVLEHMGNGICKCRCSCGVERDVRKYDLINHKTLSCGHTRTLINKKIGKLQVLYSNGDKTYHCKCDCGQEEDIRGTLLKNKKVLMCKRCKSIEVAYIKYEKEIAQRYFNDWELIEYIPEKFKWRCRCTCGNESLLHISQLINGTSKSCGHDNNKFIDLSGKRFGNLKVINYAGNKNWDCLCNCGNTCIKSSRQLRSGSSKDCGCSKLSALQCTSLVERTDEQKLAVLSKDNLIKFIGESKPTLMILSQMLGLTYASTVRLVNKFNIQNYITLCCGSSYKEQQVIDYIKSIYDGLIIIKDRSILNNKELDIYLPDKKLAFEFNGSYWHSDIFKDKKYHQNKVLDCEKKDIQLIHIYEYEWDNEYMRKKIKQYIKNLIHKQSNVIYARNTEVQIIEDSDLEHEFEDINHLQGYAKSSIKLGLFSNDELVQLMTFGVPRFNNDCDYELIRLCTLNDTCVIGGSQKLFKYFCDNYEFSTLLSYCDIDKFRGTIYAKLGFKLDSITVPGYNWVNPQTNDVVSRYRVQKKKLLSIDSKFSDMTESEIMGSFGYLRVYNSGNKKFIYKKGEPTDV